MLTKKFQLPKKKDPKKKINLFEDSDEDVQTNSNIRNSDDDLIVEKKISR